MSRKCASASGFPVARWLRFSCTARRKSSGRTTEKRAASQLRGRCEGAKLEGCLYGFLQSKHVRDAASLSRPRFAYAGAVLEPAKHGHIRRRVQSLRPQYRSEEHTSELHSLR